MTGAKTDRVLPAYRIGDPGGAHAIYDAEGSRLYPGRWNAPSSPLIYSSEHYSTAMLEKLVHANGMLLPNQHFIRITIRNGISYEIFRSAAHPGWGRQVGADLQDVRNRVVRGEAHGPVAGAVDPGPA